MKTVPFFSIRVLSFLILVSFLGIGSCKKKITDPLSKKAFVGL
jgi:hypothetical protein